MYCKYTLSCYHHSYELHISLSCRKRKAYHHLLPWWGSTNTTYFERLESVIQWNLWVLFWKLAKNSGIIVEQRTWDIVLDLIVLSFNCSRPKWRLINPMVEGIWVSLKVRIVYSNLEENSWLNTCVLLRSENIDATPDPLLSFALLRDEQRLSLGEFVDRVNNHYKPSILLV